MNDRLRKRVEEETARDSSRLRAWSRRREEKIARVTEESLLPGACRILFIGMIVSTLACATGDIRAHWRYPQLTSLSLAIRNAAISALSAWCLFGVPFVICALIQMSRGFSDPWFTRHSLTRRGTPRMEPRRKYRLQITVALAGFLLLGVFFFATRALT